MQKTISVNLDIPQTGWDILSALGGPDKILTDLISEIQKTELDLREIEPEQEHEDVQRKNVKKLTRLLQKDGTQELFTRRNKLFYIISYLNGTLKRPDIDSAKIILNLKPNVPIESWIFNETPKIMPVSILDFYKQDLARLKKENLLKPRVYNQLMNWLNKPTPEDVDKWLLDS